NRNLVWTDQVLKQFMGEKGDPVQIVGVVADVDDENIMPQQAMTAWQPGASNGRLFVRTVAKDPYTLVPAITRIIRQRAPDQPVERAATLEDVKADILSPDRLNTLVFGAFALVALTIAIVGVAGVLAFSVSTRTKEFGIRMAIGSEPSQLLGKVLMEGAAIAGIGVVSGAVAGVILTRVASAVFGVVRMPGPGPVAGAAALLVGAAMLASWMPAARAARVDILQALRSE
ncbi:MAG TPA: FtsX-like permease family protein, partial [Gemmatimonadaceae bacterium]